MKALDESTAHWERMVSGKRVEIDSQGGKRLEAPYCEDCALCHEFVYDNCKGCPIRNFTGAVGCLRTPFSAASNEWLDNGIDSPEFKKAGQEMVDFLKKVRSEL